MQTIAVYARLYNQCFLNVASTVRHLVKPFADCSVNSKAKIAEQYGEYRSVLARYVSRVIDCPSDAEDIVQEVYVRLAQRFERGQEALPATSRAYMFAIANNLITDSLRRKRSRKQDKHCSLEQFEQVSPAPGPEANAISAKLRQDLVSAIEQLPHELKQVFIMSRFENISYPSIAKHLHISSRTVERRMQRALLLVRARLDVYFNIDQAGD